MNWPNFVLGIFYSLLPRAWWGSWRPSSTVDFNRSALVSGLLECFGLLYLIGIEYLHFLSMRVQQMQAVSGSNESTQLYFFIILTLEFAFHPLTLIALLLSAEGAVRAWAAYFTDEIMPSLPLKIIAVLHQRSESARREKELGPAIPDLFERLAAKEGELRICSQRPKDGWRLSSTIAVEGEFYEVSRVEECGGARPIEYFLRKFPRDRVIRGGYRYEPPTNQ
jgi:hypothetical protein